MGIQTEQLVLLWNFKTFWLQFLIDKIIWAEIVQNIRRAEGNKDLPLKLTCYQERITLIW